jgi:predicted mannosyl-3-phosphoglycerate phosphatase (HAD superfamily)
LPIEYAGLVGERMFVEVYYHPDVSCREAIAVELRKLGYYSGVGRNFLHVGFHKGKAFGVRAVKELVPWITHRNSIALGDSSPDVEMLEESDIPVVIPRSGVRLRLRRGDYLVAPYPAPKGWEYVIRKIVLMKSPLISAHMSQVGHPPA